MTAVRYLLTLAERFPLLFDTLELDVPDESNNAVPDVIEQALWNVDYYMTTQRSDGAVRGGFDSKAHPQYGDLSFANSMTWFCYRPDPWSTFIFASGAAFASLAIAPYDSARADRYR